jgi:lysophospholipase L1-like esterase
MKTDFLSWGLAVVMSVGAVLAAEPSGFQFKPQDRVVMIGGTLIERETETSAIETSLTALNPGLGLTFRNLGWSGDTVWGHARSYFDAPADGLKRLRSHLQQIKPTVVVCGYGSAESWLPEAERAQFPAAYAQFIDLVRAEAGPEVRIILVGPPAVEPLPPPFPDVTLANGRLRSMTEIIGKVADERGATFVDLAAEMKKIAPVPGAPRLSENGVTFTTAGYVVIAKALANGLHQPGAEKADFWVELGSSKGALAPLQTAICEKNRLFFHRWRPQNETYLFGFRKHEQGRNGAEIPLFDPLIEAKEKVISGWQLQPKG